MSYEKALRTALYAAEEAGELLRRELHRWGGPKGHSSHAEADEEAEWLIRKRLLAEFPAYSYRGEETGSVKGSEPYVWLVDPNDGTNTFLRGGRGSAVSIALLCNSIPVLGVVYSFACPDDRGDMIYWAEGFELTRNSRPIRPDWQTEDREHAIVLVSLHRENLMSSILDTIRPFRFRALPSIAYRLALAAAGDGVCAVSWHNPGDWDYAAGHALLRGAGGIFIDQEGRDITYAEDGRSSAPRCFGGHPSIARDLSRRDWSRIRAAHDSPSPARSYFLFARPQRGKAVASPGLLSRAQGCLLGQCAGDALGEQVEFLASEDIRRQHPRGVKLLKDGGQWNTIAGQPTDDTEMALMLARSITAGGGYVREKAAQAYHYWFETEPFDIGTTTLVALSGIHGTHVDAAKVAQTMNENAKPDSQANGSLMRISPLGIFGYRKKAEELWSLAEQDSSLTHKHPVCTQACALFTAAIAHAVGTGAAPRDVYSRTLKLAEARAVEPSLLNALRSAEEPVRDTMKNQGWVLIAFQNAFHQLLHAGSLEEGVVDTVAMGGDTDTNGAIAGALLGAVYGRDAVPFQWSQMVLSCRPDSVTRARRVRPFCFWPVDILILAELLLLAG